MIKSKLFPDVILHQLLHLRFKSPIISAAADARLRCIIFGEMQITSDGSKPSAQMTSITENFWIPLISKIEQHLTAFGFVPFRLTERKVFLSDGKDVLEKIAVIPDLTTYKIYVDINADGERVLRGLSTIDEEEVFIVRSSMHEGPMFGSDDVGSDLGVLLEECRNLDVLERLVNSVVCDIVFPHVFAENVPSAEAPRTNATVNRTAHEDANVAVGLPPGVYYTDTEVDIQAKRLKTLRDTREKIIKGEPVDPIDAIVYLPPSFKLCTQPRPTVIPPLLGENRGLFESHVASVFKVPESFLSAAKGGQINGKQSITASDNDKIRFKQGVDALQHDIIHVIEILYDMIHHIPVKVILPTAAHATLESLVMLKEHEAIGGKLFNSEAKRAVGLHVDL